MTAPLINLYRTKEEAFYFKNSQINRFYTFFGVQLLPNNPLAYVQVTDTPLGLNLEDWTVYAVNMRTQVKTNITASFMVEQLTNSLNGNPQLFWSLKNVPVDFGYEPIFLEVDQAIGETFYSTPFLLTADESEKTTQFYYKDKKSERYQSIGFKCWFRSAEKKTELTTYYEQSTRHTVVTASKTNKTELFKTEIMSIDDLIRLTDVLESPYLYVKTVRASLFEAVEVPKATNQGNFGSTEFTISLNKNDILGAEIVINIAKDYDKLDYNIVDYFTN